MKHLFKFLFPVIILFVEGPATGQVTRDHWVDSVYNSLTTEQRIAQLLVIRTWAWKDSVYNDSLIQIVKQFNPGGVCIFRGTPVKQALLTNRLQQTAQTPLLVSTDAEWGAGMRLDSSFAFPRQMALGAIRNDSLIYRMGLIVAANLKRLGIQVNFAPVADVNNNPANPVIGFRSFGENRELVARKSAMYMKGLQDGGVMAVAKHFPGHGDTDSDSHLTLPVITHARPRLDSVELYPFRELIADGVEGVMVAHLYLPCLDTSLNTPATLSRNVITGLLKEQLGFRGYVITDALDMQGVTKHFKPGEIEVKALQAGNDILLLPQHVDKAVKGIKTAIDSGWISDSLLEARCKRMLALKYDLGLKKPPVIDPVNLVADINPPEANLLHRQMVDQSLTLVKNELQILPLTGLERRKLAVLCLGDSVPGEFQATLGLYSPMASYSLPRRFAKTLADSIFREVTACDIVILGVRRITSNAADTFGLTGEMQRLMDTVMRVNRTILTLFGTPYSMKVIPSLNRPEAILIAYQDNAYTRCAAAEAIFGGIGTEGRLPVTAGQFPFGSGESTSKCRLGSVATEEFGIPGKALGVIDSIAQSGITAQAYPGCQVLLAKDGKIFYQKAFGHPRYDDTVKVTATNLYDFASVTKIAATTLAVMKLCDEGRLNPADSLGKYLPFLSGTNKSGLRIRDVMAHQAGLQDWIPFYKRTLRDGQPDPAIYRSIQSDEFPSKVAENIYIRKDYADTICRIIANSPLRGSGEYKYSDLGFILLRFIVEKVTHQPFEKYLDTNFYKPLGLTTGFLPRERFGTDRLIPTEYDGEFRKQLVWGDVHDPGAAMLGGVSGHAGLFGTAYDLAVIMQMLLQEGEYGGKQYISQKTVREFTRAQFPEKGNRRGLGFDKPALNPALEGPTCHSASPLCFGHTGFTGTCAWADPDNGLVFVFLSNRICPSAANRKLTEMNIRTNIQQAAYDLLKQYQIK